MESTDETPVNAVAGNTGTPAGAVPDANSAEPSQASGTAMLKPIRQIVIFVLGMSVLVVGIAMIVLPGPATVLIPAGLAILATEFVWAARWLKYLKNRAQDVVDWTTTSKTSGTAPSAKDTGKAEPTQPVP